MPSDPWTDSDGAGLQALARGQIDFLKSAVRRESDNTIVAPDISSFSDPDVVQILDPDGVDVTDTWVTNTLDPEDDADTYDDSHQDYVGDLSTGAENLGVFAQSYNNGGGVLSGRLAQKVKVPVGAEITLDVPDRFYRVRWKLTRGGVPITDPDSGGYFEDAFNVAQVAEVIFGPGPITPSDVKTGFSTSLSDADITRLIGRATARARLHLRKCGIKTSSALTVALEDSGVREGITFYTQYLISLSDHQSGGLVIMRKEGSKQVRYSASSKDLSGMLRSDAIETWDLYCEEYGPHNRSMFKTFRRGPRAGRWDIDDRSADHLV